MWPGSRWGRVLARTPVERGAWRLVDEGVLRRDRRAGGARMVRTAAWSSHSPKGLEGSLGLDAVGVTPDVFDLGVTLCCSLVCASNRGKSPTRELT